MSDLSEFRDHARAMADPNPPRRDVGPFCKRLAGLPAEHDECSRHAPAGFCGCDCHPWNAPVPESERQLWASLADEVGAYLAGDESDDEPLFGGDS